MGNLHSIYPLGTLSKIWLAPKWPTLQYFWPKQARIMILQFLLKSFWDTQTCTHSPKNGLLTRMFHMMIEPQSTRLSSFRACSRILYHKQKILAFLLPAKIVSVLLYILFFAKVIFIYFDYKYVIKIIFFKYFDYLKSKCNPTPYLGNCKR